jgi:type III pantothenate kinase
VVHKLSNESTIPFENSYATPTTLGVDRIALIACAAVKFPEKNVLVVDAGSAVTYDFLNSENHYLGGAIAPGLNMRYKALKEFTANLPLLEKQFPENFIGNSTNKAMHVGVVLGMIDEIDGSISRYKEQYADLIVILTGGDTDFLRDRLKNDIFANSKFLLEGLNYILEQNNE